MGGSGHFVDNTDSGQDIILGSAQLSCRGAGRSKVWMPSFVVLLDIVIGIVKLVSMWPKDEFAGIG
jgi:hypothetical protein